MTCHFVLQYQIEKQQHQKAKYLAKSVSPIGTIEHTISNTRNICKTEQERKVPLGYKMVSLDIEYTLWQNEGAGLKKYGFGGQIPPTITGGILRGAGDSQILRRLPCFSAKNVLALVLIIHNHGNNQPYIHEMLLWQEGLQ